MEKSILPPELKAHSFRLGSDVSKWLQIQLTERLVDEVKILPLPEFTDFLFDIISSHEVIDTEIAYIACKGGIMTGKLTKVLSISNSKHPAVLAYQALAHIFLNNFTSAEEKIFIAKNEVENTKDDIYVYAEIFGILIYYYNARYQFFQGVKVLGETYEFLEKFKEERELYPEFFQWIRVSGAKSLLKLGHVKEAIYTNKRALLSASNSDRYFTAFALLGIGHCLDYLGKTKESIRHYKKSLKFAYEIKSHNLISIIFNRLGMASAWRLDNTNQGVSFFTKAITYAEKGESIWLKEGPQWNLIALYRVKKDYGKAIASVELIIESARKIGESRTELIALLNLGELLEDKGDIEESNKVREVAESLASIIGINTDDFYDVEDTDEIDDEYEDEDEDDLLENEYYNENPTDDDFFSYFNKQHEEINDVFKDDDFSTDDYVDDDENLLEELEETDDILKKFFGKKSSND